MKRLIQLILNLKHDYEWLFFKNEFNELTGEKYNRLSRLIAILLVTFLALSYAKGSYDYLNQKMNNPFTNWVTVPIETQQNELKRQPIQRYFEKDENRKAYGLSNLSGYSSAEEFFYTKNDTTVIDQLGRTVEPDKERNLLKQILNEDNVIWTKLDLSTDTLQIGNKSYYDIIINSDFLKRLGYDEDKKLYKVRCEYQANKTDLWLNVIALVKQLPNNASYLHFPNLYNALDRKTDFTFIDGEAGNQFQLLAKEADKTKFINQMKETLSFGDDIDVQSTEVEPFEISDNQTLHLYKFFLKDELVTNQQVREELDKAGTLESNDIWHYVPFNQSTRLERIEKPYYFAFNFDKLHFVRKFKDFMKKEHKIEVEMSQVESKENFAFVSALTRTISLILFILGLATIIIYLINLLSTHLNSIKKNLGTYKAFGLSDAKLNSIYLKIVFSILCIGTLFSFIIIFVIGKLRLIDRLLPKLIAGLDPNIQSISVFNNWNVLAVLLLFSLSIFLTYQTIKRILNKTPGDLIYNRT